MGLELGTMGLFVGGRGITECFAETGVFMCVGVEPTWLGLGDRLGEEFRLDEEELCEFLFEFPIPIFDLAETKLLDTLESVVRPVDTPPFVFFSVGRPPAKRPPMPGSGPEG